ncbi:MAG: hypothetical protein U0Q55_16660 [Vicinamibacterales bacterium]
MRLVDRPWPEWHPQKELRAQDLLGLEDFLLARCASADDGAFGVESLNLKTSFTTEPMNASCRLAVCRLKGVTPAGEPVWLRTEEMLDIVVALPVDPRRPAADRVTILDLWVDVNPRREGDGDKTDMPPKLRLRGVTREDAAAPQPPSLDPDQVHSLYLGRYVLSSQGGLDLALRPPVRHLGAIEPHNAKWTEWVQPLRTRLNDLLLQAEAAVDAGGATSSVLHAALSRLLFEWPALTIPRLARELRYVKWLEQRLSQPGSEAAADARSALKQPPLTDAPGHDLPVRLAALLPERLSAPRVSGGTELVSAVRNLVDWLATRDVDYFAPTEMFRQWLEELFRARGVGRSTERSEALFRELSELLRSTSVVRTSAWARTTAWVTVAVLEATTGGAFDSSGLPDAPPSRGTAAMAAACLGELIERDAAQRRAGPVAFYWLLRAVSDVSDIVRQAPDSVQRCADLLNRRAVDAKNARSGGASSRVVQYVQSTLTADVLADVKPSVQTTEVPRRMALALPARYNIVMLGMTGAGKSTLVSQLPALTGSEAGRRVAGSIELSEPAAAETGRGRTGRLVLAGGQRVPLALDVYDISHETDLSATSAGATDLLLVAVAPDDIESGRIGLVAAAVQRLLDRAAGAQVAILYTKADQYGVVDPRALRADEGRRSDLKDYGQRRTEPAWAKFTAEAARGPMTNSRYGIGVITTPGQRGVASEFGPTRRWVLSGTRPLWDVALGAPRNDPHRLLGAYFVAVAPSDPRLEPPENRGVLQVMADLLAKFGDRRS